MSDGLHRIIRGTPLGDVVIVAKSPAMRQAVDIARRVARVDSTVLITGEAGSGKELFARLVHDGSVRATGPFLVVHCGVITETLLRSELFGHARDAFPGATQDRPGLFEVANRGTLVLKEIGDLSFDLQDELLKALSDKRLRRLGDEAWRPFDVRVLVATSRDLAARVAAGTFRQELLLHLKVVEVRVPPLRERQGDLLPLARLLLAQACANAQRKVAGLAPVVAEKVLRYDWPGNVRELEHALEQAVAVANGARVEVEDLPKEVRQARAGATTARANVRPLDEVEKEYIIAALQLNGGNQTHTAEQLRIGSATLYRKLKSYGLITAKRSVDDAPDREPK